MIHTACRYLLNTAGDHFLPTGASYPKRIHNRLRFPAIYFSLRDAVKKGPLKWNKYSYVLEAQFFPAGLCVFLTILLPHRKIYYVLVIFTMRCVTSRIT